jgi:TonB family protein
MASFARVKHAILLLALIDHVPAFADPPSDEQEIVVTGRNTLKSGTTRVSLSVDNSHRVTNCKVISSSGDADLDRITREALVGCRLKEPSRSSKADECVNERLRVSTQALHDRRSSEGNTRQLKDAGDSSDGK